MESNNFWRRLGDGVIIAHRGYRAIRAENTLSAFKEANGKCDLVELDVGFSKDGVAIVIHDDTLERTTNAKDLPSFNAPFNIADYTYKEISKLNASSWFIKTDPFGTIKSGLVKKEELEAQPIQRVPTLKEVLHLLKELNLAVNVEIKNLSNTPFDTVAPKQILEEIKNLNMQNRVIISSFNHNYLKVIKELDSNIEIAVLQEHKHPKDIVAYLKSLGTNNYNIAEEICNEKTVRYLTAKGINVSVFTINSKEQKEQLFSWGVKAVFTDFLS